MNNEIDLHALWQQQSVVVAPDSKKLLSSATRLKHKARNKLILSNVLLLFTAVFICYVVYSFHPKMITTWAGVITMVAAMAAYLFVYNGMAPILLKDDAGLSVKDHLRQFIQLKHKQEFLNKSMLSVYYILLSAGFVLYLVEIAGPMSVWGKTAAYGCTFGWIAISWFYIRPKTFKKQNAALDAIISKLEELDKQLEDENDIDI